MLIQPYQLDELRFAYCYRVYLRWRTHRAKPCPPLHQLNQAVLEEIGRRYEIHVLEATSSDTDTLLLASLKPQETVAACAGKLKGQISKWLRGKLGLSGPENVLSKGYFACTSGRSTTESVDRYLQEQGEHHGYAKRPLPPVFVQQYELTAADEDRINPKHAYTVLQHHVVLATWWRQGVFGRESAEAVSARWEELFGRADAALVKVSFVPGHSCCCPSASQRVACRVSPADDERRSGIYVRTL